MKKLSLLLLLFVLISNADAQLLRLGLYAGAGFANEKSDYFNIGSLPINKGGFNLHYGLHVNKSLGKKFELETGLNKVAKGYAYHSISGVFITEYNKITTITVPVTLLAHVINYPESMPFRMSVGLGAFASYAVSGRIIHEDGSHSSATFSNAKRMEAGPKWMVKLEFRKKFEVYGTADIGTTNIIKNGTGYIKQRSLQLGFGYIFK